MTIPWHGMWHEPPGPRLASCHRDEKTARSVPCGAAAKYRRTWLADITHAFPDACPQWLRNFCTMDVYNCAFSTFSAKPKEAFYFLGELGRLAVFLLLTKQKGIGTQRLDMIENNAGNPQDGNAHNHP